MRGIFLRQNGSVEASYGFLEKFKVDCALEIIGTRTAFNPGFT